MNIKLIIAFVSYFDATMQQRRLLDNTKDNFIYKTNLKIHDTTNKLLLYLKLDKNLTKSDNNQKLITMDFYFNNISVKNYRVYEEIKNINDFFSSKSNLDELLQEIVEEEIDIIKNYVVKLANRSYESQFLNDTIKTNDAEEPQENFIDIWSKFNDKRVENIIDSIINENISSDALSSSAIAQNQTSSVLSSNENFEKILSELSDKTIANIIDPIITEKKVPETDESLLIADNNSNDVEIWHSETLDNETRRIYKGRKTKIKNYPFVASLHLMSEFLCAGSIISVDMVLTAASCLQIAYNNKLFLNNPRTIFVRVGSVHTKHSGKLIPVIRTIFHPKYDSVTLKNNLAIVKMLKKIKHMKKRKIKKIKFDESADILPKSVKEITILGWGARDAKDKPKNFQRLTMSRLDIYNIKDCREIYSKYYVTDMNFCAGFTTKGGGACMGDVGGPAVISQQLVGIISFGPTVCGMPDAPTVFTKVGYYSKWINEVLTKQLPKKKSNYKTTTRNTPNILIIPLYTTPSHTKHSMFYTKRAILDTTHSISQTVNIVPHTKNEHKPRKPSERALKDDPEEIEILKKLITDFILGNHTVIDYLTNGEVNYNDKASLTENISEDNEKLFLDSKRYHLTELRDDSPTQDNVIIKSINIADANKIGKDIKNYNDKTKSDVPNNIGLIPILLTAPQVTKTTPRQSDYEGIPTKLATFVESSEFPEDDFSSDLDIKSLLSDDSSSYYEIEIAIDDTAFNKTKEKPKVKTKNLNNTEIVKIPIVKESSNINIYHKKLTNAPNLVKNKDREKGLYNIYHKLETEPKNKETQNESNKKKYLSSSEISDTIIHFVTSETASSSSKANYYDKHFRKTTTSPAPKGMAMTISLEDFNYEYDRKQTKSKTREILKKKYDYK